MGKFQPSDNTPHQDGKASIVGVFLTGSIIFLLSFFYPIQSTNIEQSLGILFAVFTIYFLDHYFDYKIISGPQDIITKINKTLALLFGLFTLGCVALFWRIFLLNNQFYFGLLGLILYSIIYAVDALRIRFAREFIVAVTAAWIVCIKPESSMDFLAFISLGIVFFQNVVLFSFFEKEKDVRWGFKNSFSLTLNTYIILIQFSLLALLLGLMYFFELNHGLVYVSISYLFLSIIAQKFALKPYYRFLIDSLLIGVLIP